MTASEGERRIREIVEPWWMSSGEPILFQVYNEHKVTRNDEGTDNIRVGQGRIEFNEEWVLALDKNRLKAVLIAEGMRVLLKHPYARKKASALKTYMASSITLAEYVTNQLEFPEAKKTFSHMLKSTMTPEQKKFKEFYEENIASGSMTDDEVRELTDHSPDTLAKMYSALPTLDDKDLQKRHMEYYYSLLEDDFENGGQSVGNFLDGMGEGMSPPEGQDGDGQDDSMESRAESLGKNADLWDENPFMKDQIDSAIKGAMTNEKSWGSIPGNMRDKIIATLKPKADYKKMMRAFKASILSSERVMTRMKPSRRFGYDMMGRKDTFNTKLIVYLDTSGSVSDRSIRNFFSFVNRFFKYGVSELIFKQFDTKLYSDTFDMKKARKSLSLIGRGGTDFNGVFEDITNTQADGYVILTDMCAPEPKKFRPSSNKKKQILWVAENEKNYNEHLGSWHRNYGKMSFIIPE